MSFHGKANAQYILDITPLNEVCLPDVSAITVLIICMPAWVFVSDSRL